MGRLGRMQFYRALYFSPNMEHRGMAKWRLQHNAGSLALYVITLCDESLTKTGQQGEFPAAHFLTPVGGESNGDGSPWTQKRSRENRPHWTHSGNQLQFFHSVFLQSSDNRKHCPMIIGLAEGRHEAVELVRQIVEETWAADGDYDIVRYLAKRDRRIHPSASATIEEPDFSDSDEKDKVDSGQKREGRKDGAAEVTS